MGMKDVMSWQMNLNDERIYQLWHVVLEICRRDRFKV